MGLIKRYDAIDDGGWPVNEVCDPEGKYVLHADHEEAMSEQHASMVYEQIDLHEEIARLRGESDLLRAALENIASIRLNDHPSIDAAYGHACSIANEALFDIDDQAMGAQA